MAKQVDLSSVGEPAALAIIETLLAEIRALKELVQQQRDEIARLKREQGKPEVRPRAKRTYSSERERPREVPPAPPTPPQGGRTPLVVVREEVLRLDRSTLPASAGFAGYEDFVVQELVLQAEVVRYRREAYRDLGSGQRWVAPLPRGLADHFGPQLKALVLYLSAVSGLSEPLIQDLLRQWGVRISAGTLNDWLVHDLGPWHAEAAVYAAGLASAPFQQIDDTLTRSNGQPHHCQVVCNPCYTSYHTTPGKDRLTIIDLLRPGHAGQYLLDDLALDLLSALGVSAGVRAQVGRHLPRDTLLDHAQLSELLRARLGHLGDRSCSRVYDALAIAAYQQQTAVPVVQVLVCDEAGQFAAVSVGRALCWIHDARHYKKLLPHSWEDQALLETFLRQYWALDAELLAYRAQPTAAEATRLREAFGCLFRTVTGYPARDARIAKTLAHQPELLQVLEHLELPLHNNRSQLGARRRVRRRDVSFGPRTPAGAKAWASLQTLAATARQLGVNFWHYLNDRLSGASQLPSLAEQVTARAATLNLGASWA